MHFFCFVDQEVAVKIMLKIAVYALAGIRNSIENS